MPQRGILEVWSQRSELSWAHFDRDSSIDEEKAVLTRNLKGGQADARVQQRSSFEEKMHTYNIEHPFESRLFLQPPAVVADTSCATLANALSDKDHPLDSVFQGPVP